MLNRYSSFESENMMQRPFLSARRFFRLRNGCFPKEADTPPCSSSLCLILSSFLSVTYLLSLQAQDYIFQGFYFSLLVICLCVLSFFLKPLGSTKMVIFFLNLFFESQTCVFVYRDNVGAWLISSVKSEWEGYYTSILYSILHSYTKHISCTLNYRV